MIRHLSSYYKYVYTKIKCSSKICLFESWAKNRNIEAEMIFYCQKTHQRNEGNKSYVRKISTAGDFGIFQEFS